MRYVVGVLRVMHPSDIITELSKNLMCESLLTNITLVGTDTHGILMISRCSRRTPSSDDVLDFLSTSALIKESSPICRECKDKPIFYIVKRSFGVQKAIADARAVKSSTVHHDMYGFKHFWVGVEEARRDLLVSLVKAYAREAGERDTWVKFKTMRFYTDIERCAAATAFLVGATHGRAGSHQLTSLSKMEYYVLRKALELGYLDWPRRCSLEKLSRELDLSKATALEHLRKAIRKVVSEYFMFSSS